MSHEPTLNFDRWKTISEIYHLIRVWLRIVYKINDKKLLLLTSPNSFKFKEVFNRHWQKKHSNLKTICHINPKYFLRTKLLEKVLLAKYLIYVTAALGQKGVPGSNCHKRNLVTFAPFSSRVNLLSGLKFNSHNIQLFLRIKMCPFKF